MFCFLFQGKFGQRENLSQAEFISSTERYNELIFSDNMYEVKHHSVLTEDLAFVVFKNLMSTPNRKANIFIAAFTTAHARLHLYETVHKLGTRAIYMDTDSVVFWSTRGRLEWKPKLDNYLGGWTDEVNGDDITEFITCGPKNYSCTSSNPRSGSSHTMMKVKGLRQTLLTAPILNTTAMKDQQALFINSKRARPQEEQAAPYDNTPKRPCLDTLQKRTTLQQEQVDDYFFFLNHVMFLACKH